MSSGAQQAAAPPTGWRLWLTAVRPRTLTLSVVPVFLGSALAWAEGAPVAVLTLLAALLAAALLQAGANLHNDAVDFERGNDKPGRQGPTRVTAAGWATPAQVHFAAKTAFGLAFLFGLYLVAVGGWPFFLLGLASLAAGYAYSGGPRPVSYTPAGEVFVFLFFGLVAVAGSHYLQSGHLSAAGLLGGAAMGFLASAVLMVNNYRDLDGDAAVGRRTLAVALGRERSRKAYTLMVTLPFVCVLGLWPLLPAHAPMLLALAALPKCIDLAHAFGQKKGAALNPVLGETAQAQLVFGALLCAGLAL
jgi:1,4-dihydroxy-2-naphthoate polyprenyltransferase